MTEFFIVVRRGDNGLVLDMKHPTEDVIEAALNRSQALVEEGINSQVYRVRDGGLGEEVAAFKFLGGGRYQFTNVLADTVKVKTIALH